LPVVSTLTTLYAFMHVNLQFNKLQQWHKIFNQKGCAIVDIFTRLVCIYRFQSYTYIFWGLSKFYYFFSKKIKIGSRIFIICTIMGNNVATVFSFVMSVLPKKVKQWKRHQGIQYNDTQHNNIQYNNTQHNNIQHNDTQHNDIQQNDTQHKGLICDTQFKW